ncbi:MAG: DUF2849 domain-containing protein [Alphaproteobacteria bacterium]|jgi:hypothetical protein
MTRQVISANRLSDGLVVYLTDNDDWSERIIDARIVEGEESAAAAMRAAADAVARQFAVDPYAIEIEMSGGERRPTRFRELIRAKGPTVRPDLGKQAAPG